MDIQNNWLGETGDIWAKDVPETAEDFISGENN